MDHRFLLLGRPATVLVQEAPASVARPATSEQALEMLDLMLADVIAQAEITMAGWAERFPVDHQDAARSTAAAQAARDRLSHMTQDYARRHGKLDVPLISLGSDYGTMRAALRPVIDQISKGQEQATPAIANPL